jgi:hypothetical protein
MMARMGLRFDGFEVTGNVQPGYRLAVMNFVVSRKFIEAVFRDKQKPVDVDRIVGTIRTTPEVLIALTSMAEGRSISHVDHRQGEG